MKNSNEISTAGVQEALKRILQYKGFASSEGLTKFLTYVVQQKLQGKEEDLKAYTIAVDALGRSGNFDPQIDPVVRVMAGRLRSVLSEYYHTDGIHDPLRIEIPTGSYRPEFTVNETQLVGSKTSFVASTTPSSKRFSALVLGGLVLLSVGYFTLFPLQKSGDSDNSKITIAMRQQMLGNSDQATDDSAMQLFQGLRSALSRNEAVLVIKNSSGVTDNVTKDVDFILDGTIQRAGVSRNLAVELLNGKTNGVVWSRSFPFDINDQNMPLHEAVITKITRELNSQIFGASVEALQGRNPKKLSANQLFVLATWVPGPAKSTLEWEKERVQLARLALEKDRDFGPAYSVLADKLAYLAAIDGPSNTEENRKEGHANAQRALTLAGGDTNVLFNVAQHYWHAGELNEAILAHRRILELDPNHGFAKFFSTVIPYTCSAAPDETLNAAIEFDKSLGADNPIRWVTLTWIGWLHLNREELRLALKAEEHAAQIFQIPYTIMRHATVLNLLGQTDEAAALIKKQRRNWPNLDPNHFAKVTIPRLCTQRKNAGKMIGFYETLARSMEGRL